MLMAGGQPQGEGFSPMWMHVDRGG